jgi:hypothetical protein
MLGEPPGKRPTESSANKVLPSKKWNEARNVPEHPGSGSCHRRRAVLVVELIEDVAASTQNSSSRNLLISGDGLTTKNASAWRLNLGLEEGTIAREARPIPHEERVTTCLSPPTAARNLLAETPDGIVVCTLAKVNLTITPNFCQSSVFARRFDSGRSP